MGKTFKDAFIGHGIATPAKVTRRGYRVRIVGETVHFPPETGLHYSDSPRVARRYEVTKRESQHPRFTREATEKFGKLWS